MLEMLIIADDFTGAMDTGVKFSAAGVKTQVTTNCETDFSHAGDTEVLVLCAPTRHLPAEEAYLSIFSIAHQAVKAGIPIIFKKTDSALRGNVGAELSAVLDGSGEKVLCFLPALPSMCRITRQGVHYIDGVPVSESVFGLDPFEPVQESYIPDLLHRQCDIPVHILPAEAAKSFPLIGEKCIYLFDCSSKEEMDMETTALHYAGRLKVLAGCSGLAESLTAILGGALVKPRTETFSGQMIVVCGSMNPISYSQMDYAEQQGYCRAHIPVNDLLGVQDSWEENHAGIMDRLWETYLQSPCLMIDTRSGGKQIVQNGARGMRQEYLRQRVSRCLAEIVKALLDRGADARLMIIGGDTLQAFLETVHCQELTPVCEIQPGVVLSQIVYNGHTYELISKSGGFGERELLVNMLNRKDLAEQKLLSHDKKEYQKMERME